MAISHRIMTDEQRAAKTAYTKAWRARKKAMQDAAAANNANALRILPEAIINADPDDRRATLDAIAALPEDAPFLEPVPSHDLSGASIHEEPSEEDEAAYAAQNADGEAADARFDRSEGPGLARLRAANAAKGDAIRQNALNDAAEALSAARSRIEESRPAKVEDAPKAERKPTASRAAKQADAEAGILPTPPDFSAESHKRHRAKRDEVVRLVNMGDLDGLVAWAPPGFVGSSMKAILRYRDLAVIALKARS